MGDDDNGFDGFLVKIRNIIFAVIIVVLTVMVIGKAIIGG